MMQTAEMAHPLSRITNRVKRQILSQFPPARWAADGRHEERRRNWAPYLPTLDPQQSSLVPTLNGEAIWTGPLDDLQVPGTAGHLERIRTGLSERQLACLSPTMTD